MNFLEGFASFVMLWFESFRQFSPAGKGLTSWLLMVMFIVFFVTLPCRILGPGGVVLDCIVSWSLVFNLQF